MLSSKKTGGRDDWSTPSPVFQRFNKEYDFSLDACASKWNAKCSDYYTEKLDGLLRDWVSWTWCNPPYSQLIRWYAKAYQEAEAGNSSVILTAARTDTKAFHEYATKSTRLIFLRGRVKFIDPATHLPREPAPFPSMVVIFDAYKLGTPCQFSTERVPT
tara:strand:+ start:213 stop:689 length:477 start_codon:yes stop_codon:yes gene_type:complete